METLNLINNDYKFSNHNHPMRVAAAGHGTICPENVLLDQIHREALAGLPPPNMAQHDTFVTIPKSHIRAHKC